LPFIRKNPKFFIEKGCEISTLSCILHSFTVGFKEKNAWKPFPSAYSNASFCANWFEENEQNFDI